MQAQTCAILPWKLDCVSCRLRALVLPQLLKYEQEKVVSLKHELLERPSKEDMLSFRKQIKLLQKTIYHVDDEDSSNEDVSDESLAIEHVLD